MNNINFRKVTYPGIIENKYFISENGILYNSLSKKYPKYFIDKDGYFRVALDYKKYYVHRLVAWEFHPKTRNIKLVIDHLDGNKQNNDFRNLEWVTSGENTRRAIAMGLRDRFGEKNNLNKHSEKIIRYIFELLSQGKSNMEIVRILMNLKNKSISSFSERNIYTLVYRLRNGQLWAHVGKEYSFPIKVKSKHKFIPSEKNLFTEEEIHNICKLGVLNVRPTFILEKLGINKNNSNYNKYCDAVNSILRCETWPYIGKQYNLPESRYQHRLIIDDNLLNELVSKNLSVDEILNVFYFNNSKSAQLLKDIITLRVNKIKENNKIQENKDIKFSKIVVNKFGEAI